MSVIFLIGPRGCGKSRIAKMLSQKLDAPFCDTDKLVVAQAGKSIARIVAEAGWEMFRDYESATLGMLHTELPHGGVVATGGGMVLRAKNRKTLRRLGTVIYLKAPPDVLAARLQKTLKPTQRPSLTGEDPVAEMVTVFAERQPLYLKTAHHVIDATLPPAKVVAAILDLQLFSWEHV